MEWLYHKHKLGLCGVRLARATSTSTINIVTLRGSVIVRISRPGANGFQVMESRIGPSGVKSVVQKAYDAAGNLAHYDPKTP